MLGTFAVAGVLCAFLWHWWWGPAPTGFAFDNEPFFGADLEFRSTGTYVVISVAAGLLLGSLFSVLLDRDEVVTLVLLAVGAGIAAVLMSVVGRALGPESAAELARGLDDFDPVTADLHVTGVAPYFVFPLGAVAAATVVLFAFSPRKTVPPDAG